MNGNYARKPLKTQRKMREVMAVSSELSLNNYSFASIIDLLFKCDLGQMAYLIFQQDDFHKERILSHLLPEDIAKVIIDMNDVELSATARSQIQAYLHKYPTIPASANKYQKQQIFAQKLRNSEDPDIIENAIAVLNEACLISRSEGLVELDWIFLRESGIREDFFVSLLLKITAGQRINESDKSGVKNKYTDIVYYGLRGIQEGRNCNDLLIELKKIADIPSEV